MDWRPLEYSVRRAGADDAPALAVLRAASEYERTSRPELPAAAFEAACVRYFATELAASEGPLLVWIAFAEGVAVGMAALSLATSLPRPGREAPLYGRVRSVFVQPATRRRGIATALLDAVIAEAGRRGVDRLALGASSEGRALYESLGFIAKHDEMVYRGEI